LGNIDFYNLNEHSIIKITCPLHGEFNQEAKGHMKGSGCPDCRNIAISKSRGENPTGWKDTNWLNASKTSKRFDDYKVYIIKCFNKEEEFIKIGRTYQKLIHRFRTKGMMPYNYEIIQEILGDSSYICNLERELKSNIKSYKYIPLIPFNGKHECFTIESLKSISTIPR